MICKVSDPRSQKVLMMYYLDHLNWKDIAEKIMFSESQIHRFKKEGLTEIEKMIQNE